MNQQSRRDFIKIASGAAAFGVAGTLLPARLLACTPDALCDAAGSTSTNRDLRAIAERALSAAVAAGAQYADVRVNFTRAASLGSLAGVRLNVSDTLGVRALYKSSWGFAGDCDLAPDAVAGLARLAVERAKAGHLRNPRPPEFAPAPVVKDTSWQTPVKIDPFTVPVGEQMAVLLDAQDSVNKVKGLKSSGCGVSWNRSDRIFASTEGSLITQRTYSSEAGGYASANPRDDFTFWTEVHPEGLFKGGYGYEAFEAIDLPQAMVRAASQALEIVGRPIKSVDVGRYDLVVSPHVMALLVSDTMARALELDRARGDKANSEGTSYAAPPLEVLGKLQLGPALLNVSADRSRPLAGATVGWDEEGVKPEDFALVKEGTIVDFITSRTTAPAIAQWYRQQGQQLRSHGCAGSKGDDMPRIKLPNLTIQPGKSAAGVEDLIKGVKKGFYITDAYGALDQQRINGQYKVVQGYEIREGKYGAVVRDMAFQFSTAQLWKGLHALGGSDSAALESLPVGSIVDEVRSIGVQSVPGHFRNVNVINTGRQG